MAIIVADFIIESKPAVVYTGANGVSEAWSLMAESDYSPRLKAGGSFCKRV